MKQLSDKQNKWLIRSKILWRIKGIMIKPDPSVLTEEEVNMINEINRLVSLINEHSKENSIKLGFNAIERCEIGDCNNKMYYHHPKFGNLCKKHFNELTEMK